MQVHFPDIGVWKVDGIVRDFRGREFYKLSRRTGGATEWRYIAAAGVEILNQIEAD